MDAQLDMAQLLWLLVVVQQEDDELEKEEALALAFDDVDPDADVLHDNNEEECKCWWPLIPPPKWLTLLPATRWLELLELLVCTNDDEDADAEEVEEGE